MVNLSHEEHEKFLKGLQTIHQSNLDNNGYRDWLAVISEGTAQQCVACKLDPPKFHFAMLTSGILVRRSKENTQIYEPVGDPMVLTQEEFNTVTLLAKAARIKTGEELGHAADPTR
jgi:hypothetical protein